jgi:chloramphenicol-sensitive protein RarD
MVFGFQLLWGRNSRDIVGSEMSRDDFRKGVAYGVAAYGMWGLVPIYFKALSGVPALEVLAHRVVWSVVLLVPLVLVRGQWPELRRVIYSRKTLATLIITTVLIAVNWYLFIWAVDHDRVLEASLGYFINPLINVVLGMVFLGEKLSRPAAAAVVLAGLGVSVQVVMVGELPWIALTLAFSFGLYGLLRKTAAVGAVVGLAVETSMLMLPAVGYLVWARRTGGLYLGSGDLSVDVLLVLAGAVTAAPLLCFTTAVRLLPLTTLGFLQYLAPSGHFLLAVLAYGEVLTPGRIITFVCIWLALAIFTTDQVRRSKT